MGANKTPKKTENVTKTKISDEYNKYLERDPSKDEKNVDENIDGYLIRNKGHEMYIEKTDKLALNAFDDKRKFFNDT